MRFAVAGQIARDAAEALEAIKGEAVKAIQGAQGVNAVLGVPGIVDIIIGVKPGTFRRGEHEPVNRRIYFRKGGGAAPVTGRTTHHGMDIHEGNERAHGAGIRKGDRRTGGIGHGDRIFRRGGGSGCQFGNEFERREGRRGDGFHHRGVSSHNSIF